MENIILSIEGMSCGHCELAVQMAVTGVAGVKSVAADSAKKQAYIEFDSAQTNVEKIKSAIDEVGYIVLE